jgi:hypothetical protein
MCAAPPNWLLSLLACMTLFGSAGAAQAGWITIKNDTNRVLVVQCGATASGHVKRGKPVRLLPGESVREFHTPPNLTFDVFDGRSPNKLLHSSAQAVKAENQTYLVGFSGQSVVVQPLRGR